MSRAIKREDYEGPIRQQFWRGGKYAIPSIHWRRIFGFGCGQDAAL
jgi:hypothetical protein